MLYRKTFYRPIVKLWGQFDIRVFFVIVPLKVFTYHYFEGDFLIDSFEGRKLRYPRIMKIIESIENEVKKLGCPS